MENLSKVVIIGLIILMLGGCGVTQAYTNQEEAREYVLSHMQERYGEVFTVLEKEYYTSYPMYGDVYVCEVAPERNKEKTTIVRVTQRGELSDSWAVYLFCDEIIDEVRPKLIENEDIKVKSISLEASATSRVWKKEDGREEYLERSGAYLKIVATCNKGLENSDYAKIIEEFLEPIYELELNSEVSVKIGRAYIFFRTIFVDGENKTEPYTVEKLEEIVEEQIMSTPFKEELF